MSNFLKLLESLGTYVDVARDIYNYIPDNPNTLGETPGTVIDQYLPSKPVIAEKTESEDWFQNGEALTYPQDLFSTGNQAYVFFVVRDPTLDSSRVLKRIGLYMPPEIKASYGANWEEADISLDQLINFYSDMTSGDMKTTGQTVGAYAQKTIGAAISKSIGGNLGEEASIKTRILPNPAQGLLFKMLILELLVLILSFMPEV